MNGFNIVKINTLQAKFCLQVATHLGVPSAVSLLARQESLSIPPEFLHDIYVQDENEQRDVVIAKMDALVVAANLNNDFRAMDIVLRKRYGDSALREVYSSKLLQSGHASAQFAHAESSHWRARFYATDEKEALDYAVKSAEQGHESAICWLNEFALDNHGELFARRWAGRYIDLCADTHHHTMVWNDLDKTPIALYRRLGLDDFRHTLYIQHPLGCRTISIERICAIAAEARSVLPSSKLSAQPSAQPAAPPDTSYVDARCQPSATATTTITGKIRSQHKPKTQTKAQTKDYC